MLRTTPLEPSLMLHESKPDLAPDRDGRLRRASDSRSAQWDADEHDECTLMRTKRSVIAPSCRTRAYLYSRINCRLTAEFSGRGLTCQHAARRRPTGRRHHSPAAEHFMVHGPLQRFVRRPSTAHWVEVSSFIGLHAGCLVYGLGRLTAELKPATTVRTAQSALAGLVPECLDASPSAGRELWPQ